MKLLLTRHGETNYNRENRVLGRTDEPLNEKGRAQARYLAETLRGIRLDAVYASPLRRASDIGDMIAGEHGLRCQVDDRLIEMDFGHCEGCRRDDPVYLKEKRRLFARYPDGESYFEVAARVYPFLQELQRTHGDKTILVVAHNGICRVIASYFTDMSEEEFISFSMKNCEVREYVF